MSVSDFDGTWDSLPPGLSQWSTGAWDMSGRGVGGQVGPRGSCLPHQGKGRMSAKTRFGRDGFGINQMFPKRAWERDWGPSGQRLTRRGEAGGPGAVFHAPLPAPGWALCTSARGWPSRLTSTVGRPSARSLHPPQDSGSSSQVMALKSRVPEMGRVEWGDRRNPETGLVEWGN